MTELAIGDDEVAPPEVGDIGRYALLFTETPPDETDPSIITVEVDLEPLDNGVPLFQPAASAGFRDEERWWEWRLFLRGDGWTATWYSKRPIIGRQRLTGRIIGDLGYATTGSVTGRILRARIVSDTYRLVDQSSTAPPRPPRWVPVPGTRRFRDVATATGFFRDDTRPLAHLSPGEDRIRECGVLVDLDLDDVPPPSIRPALVPAAVSAHGRDVWIIDRELPILIRLHEQQMADEYRFPGAILTQFAYRPRWVHADTHGCWVAGRDGIFRCDLDGSAVRIDEHRVTGSAARDGVLLSWYRTDGQSVMSVRWPDRREQILDPVDGRIQTVHSGDDGFLGVLHTGTGIDDGHTRLFTVDLNGHLRLGPPLPPLTGSFLVGDDPTRLVDPRRGRQIPICPDLTVGDVEAAAIKGSSGGTAGPWIWVVHPAGDDRSIEPNPYSNWHCLLSLLDPVTFTLHHRLAIHSPYPEISYDGDGRIWIIAGGIWVLDPHSSEPAQHLHLDKLPEP
ncbi:hypothetical protein [Rhodococcus pyridinivorans]|uniref:hypothetical protein n=1 Tax=Rhodococcus pyridinivorans TaxID=103816 RepID=UPI0022846C52|nr:hypothetical protein [Rhodococcus pyridinivorans]WAL49290.1 hypothetical protein OQN32_26855 [Rhodococcus pyridinivorans]